MRGWNGNSRLAESGVIMAVPRPQQEHSGAQCQAHAQVEKYGCFAGSDTYSDILILKIIKLDPAKDHMKNLLEFSRLSHLFWRVQGRLKTSSSSVGMPEHSIAMSAQLRTPGCTQGCAISAGWTPLVWKGTPQGNQALLVGQYCEFPASAQELRFSLWCNILRSLGSVRFFILKKDCFSCHQQSKKLEG